MVGLTIKTNITVSVDAHNNVANEWLRSILSRGHGSTRPGMFPDETRLYYIHIIVETNKDTSGGLSSQPAADTTGKYT